MIKQEVQLACKQDVATQEIPHIFHMEYNIYTDKLTAAAMSKVICTCLSLQRLSL